MLKTQSSDWIKILWTENGGGGSYFNKRRHRCHALEERKKDRDISISGQQAILLQITGIVVLGSVVVFSKVQIRCKLSPLGYAGKVALSTVCTLHWPHVLKPDMLKPHGPKPDVLNALCKLAKLPTT